MSKALITESFLTDIGDAIRLKNGESTLYTPAEMAEAIEALETGGGTPNLQSKSVVLSETAQNVTADSGYDGLSQVSVPGISSTYVGSSIDRRSSSNLAASGATVTAPTGYYAETASKSVATATQATPSITVDSSGLITASATQNEGYVSAGTKSSTQQLTTQAATSVTPSDQTQTVGAAGRYMTGAVTVNPIPSQYVIPSGSDTFTQNGTYDVTNLAEAVVNVASSGVNIGSATATGTNYPVSLAFTGLQGEPKMFALKSTSQMSSSGSTTYYYIVDMVYNGSTTVGNCFRIGSTRRVDNVDSGYSWTYSNGTLTVRSSASSRSASPGAFNNSYQLIYVY